MFKKILFTIVFIVTFFILAQAQRAEASLKATSDYNVHVELDTEDIASIRYHIHLVNQSDGFSIRDYSLLCYHTDLSELSVLENGEAVNFKKEFIDDRVRIKVLLKEQLVAKGSKTNLVISYKTHQIFRKNGLLWELYIPPVKTEEDLNIAYFTLIIPQSLPKITYSSLEEADFSAKDEKNILKYSQRVAPFGVLFSFGKIQQFEFTYGYKFRNDNPFKKCFSITLPADGDFQRVYFFDPSEPPDRTLRDNDGNILVEYLLDPQEEKVVRITGFSRFAKNENHINLQSDLARRYLQESEIWNYSHDDVRSVINNISRSDYTKYENAGFIYEYLISNFTYSPQNQDRKSASELVSQKGEISCENFADLFVTLARGARIPARKVVGYTTVTQNIASLHMWGEFFDEDSGRWVALDPCLKKYQEYSEFDNINLNRVILAYHGLSDSYPPVTVPFVKLQNLDSNNLEIKASSFNFFLGEQSIDVDYHAGNTDLFFRSIPLTLSIQNNSRSIFTFDEVFINQQRANFLKKHSEQDYFEAVFPGNFRQFEVNFSNIKDFSMERLKNYQLSVTGKYGENTLNKGYEFHIGYPITFKNLLPWFVSGIFASLTIMLFLFALKKFPYESLKSLKSKYKFKFRKSRLRGFDI